MPISRIFNSKVIYLQLEISLPFSFKIHTTILHAPTWVTTIYITHLITDTLVAITLLLLPASPSWCLGQYIVIIQIRYIIIIHQILALTLVKYIILTASTTLTVCFIMTCSNNNTMRMNSNNKKFNQEKSIIIYSWESKHSSNLSSQTFFLLHKRGR